MQERIGKKIKLLLVKRGIKQGEFALKARVGKSQLNQYLNGWLNFPEDVEKRICKQLKIDFVEYQQGKIEEVI